MLRGLISRAAMGSTFPQAKLARDKNNSQTGRSNAPTNGRTNPAGTRQARSVPSLLSDAKDMLIWLHESSIRIFTLNYS